MLPGTIATLNMGYRRGSVLGQCLHVAILAQTLVLVRPVQGYPSQRIVTRCARCVIPRLIPATKVAAAYLRSIPRNMCADDAGMGALTRTQTLAFTPVSVLSRRRRDPRKRRDLLPEVKERPTVVILTLGPVAVVDQAMVLIPRNRSSLMTVAIHTSGVGPGLNLHLRLLLTLHQSKWTKEQR